MCIGCVYIKIERERERDGGEGDKEREIKQLRDREREIKTMPSAYPTTPLNRNKGSKVRFEPLLRGKKKHYCLLNP